MMRMRGVLVVSALLIGQALILAQEIPEYTPERKKRVDEIVAACIKDGGLKLAVTPDNQGRYLQVVDRDKVKATLAARRALLGPDLRDALLAFWSKANKESQPAVVALLGALGQENKDDHSLGLASFLAALADNEELRLEKAGAGYRAAARYFERTAQKDLHSTCLNNLGGVLQAQGSYAEAAGYFMQALEIRRRLYPEARYPGGHPALATSLNNLGSVLQYQGTYAEAADYYQQALEMCRRLYPEAHYPGGHPNLASSLSNLGSVLKAQGSKAEAAGYYQQALEMDRRLYPEARYPGGHPDLAVSLNNLGSVLHDQGSNAEAAGYYQQALEMKRRLYPEARYPDGHPDLALSLNNLGSVFQEQGFYAEAAGYFQQSLEMDRRLYPEARYPGGHPDLGGSLNNVGRVLQAQGSYAEAAGYLRQALEMNRRLYPEARYPGGHSHLAHNLNNLGGVLMAQGSYAEAVQSFQEALQASRTTPQPIDLDRGPSAASSLRGSPLTALILSNRAQLLEQGLPAQASADRLRAVEQAYSLAAALHERLRAEVLARDTDKLQHGEQADILLPHRIGLRARLFDQEGKPDDLHSAFAALEQGRARVFLEALGQTHAAALAGLPDDLRREERRLSLALRELDARIDRLQNQPGEEPARLVRQLYTQRLQTEQEQQHFTDKLHLSHPQYAGFRYPKPCSLQQARDGLADNEVALLFTVGREFSYALLLEKKAAPGDKGEGLALFRLPGRQQLDTAVSTLLTPETLLRAPRARDLAAEVYGKVLGALSTRLQGKDLLIVADGCLELLPFEMLVEGQTAEDDGSWLIEKHRIRYAPSLTALHLSKQAVAKRTDKPEKLLWALADPIFEEQDTRLKGQLPAPPKPVQVAGRGGDLSWLRGGERFARLTASRVEVEAICQALALPASAALRDGKASEANVKAASARGDLARARYVHFATHGILGAGKGQPPGLVLNLVGNDGKEEQGGPNDGFLRLPEVTFLKLNADLVVLSACETARGPRAGGEGVSGLARAFLYAGSKGVVCSLWSVDDEKTAQLMADFYQGLKEGQASSDALRAAQLRMIAKGRAPFFWAPFVLIGQCQTSRRISHGPSSSAVAIGPGGPAGVGGDGTQGQGRGHPHPRRRQASACLDDGPATAGRPPRRARGQ